MGCGNLPQPNNDGDGHVAAKAQSLHVAPRHDALIKQMMIELYIHDSPLTIDIVE